MKNNFQRFTGGFSVYTVIILIISIAIDRWVPKIKINPEFIYILLFLYSVTLAGFYFFNKALSDRISRFANVYMLGTFTRLILYSVIILVYSWLNRQNAVSFIITFFSYYILLTVYEVASLLKKTS